MDLYLKEWRKIKPYTNGKTLQELGVQPGPVYKEIFQRLTDAWINGEIVSQTEEESYLKSLLHSFILPKK